MRLSLVALLALACAAACDRSPGRLPWEHGLTFEQFVDATVQLRLAAARTATPAAYETRKREVEKRLGVSDADLRQYVNGHARDVKLLSAAWDSVEARVARANLPDTTTRPVPQAPPAETTAIPGLPPGLRPMPKAPPARRRLPRTI